MCGLEIFKERPDINCFSKSAEKLRYGYLFSLLRAKFKQWSLTSCLCSWWLIDTLYCVLLGYVHRYRNIIQCFCFGTACEPGYTWRDGDIPGMGAVNGQGRGKFVQSCRQCAELCSNDASCLSYECSPTQRKCNLNDNVRYSGESYLDYELCVKGTSNSLMFVRVSSSSRGLTTLVSAF